MYDAILSGSESAPIPAFDSEMDKFLPMLTDYLKSEVMRRMWRLLVCLLHLHKSTICLPLVLLRSQVVQRNHLRQSKP